MTRIEQEIPDQPDAERLFRLADARSLALYPGEARTGTGVEALLAHQVRFFVARIDGAAVGCGGYIAAGPTAELTRLYVDEPARGQGIGRALLAAIEGLARLERFTSMRLETGHRATAALALYAAAGYAPTAPFGPHAADPGSRFMRKSLGPAAPSG